MNRIVNCVVLFVTIFLMLFYIISCTNNTKQVKPKPKEKPLVWHIDGLPNWFLLNHARIIYKRWDIDYVLDGCGGSIEGIKQNKITAKILEKKHGKFWHEVFWQSVNEEVANRFAILDLINKYNEIVRLKKKYSKSQDYMNLRIICLDKYKYAVLVTWDSETDLEKHIPGQIVIVNIATKTVAKSDDRLKYDWREGY